MKTRIGPESPLVDARWVEAQLDDSNTVLLDATMAPPGGTPAQNARTGYASRHLPGAIFFDIEDLSDHSTTLPHMLPSAAEFGRAMGAMGVSDQMTIVVYEQAPVFSAPRAWWMLRVFGACDVKILDGGLPAWEAAGLPTSAEPVMRPAADFAASLDLSAVRSLVELERILAAGGQVIDARSAARFDGTAPEPRPGLLPGHMPGSINVPFTELFANGRMKGSYALRSLFEQRGVDLASPITTTCGSGVTAAVLKLALEQAGADEVAVYDGSWAEYAQQPGAVIEMTPVS